MTEVISDLKPSKIITWIDITVAGWAESVRAIGSLQSGKTSPHECPGYDTKQSDGEVPVMLEL